MKILHIGYPKTGTSFLQTRLFGPLARAGKVPKYVGIGGGQSRTRSKNEIYRSLSSIGSNSTTEEQGLVLTTFFASHQEFLISNEGILGEVNEVDLSAFSKRLRTFIDSDTEIVITVRNLDSYFDSWYQQRVKTDFVVSPKDLIYEPKGVARVPARLSPYPDFSRFNLDVLVESLLGHFNAVTLIDLEFPGYLEWFSNRSGLTTLELEQLIEIKAKSKRGINERLSFKWVRFLENVNSVFRWVFALLGIYGRWKRISQRDLQNLTRLMLLRYFLFLGGTQLKRRIQEIVRLLNAIAPSGDKYRLPTDVRTAILSKIPNSNLHARVKKSGGVLTLSKLDLLGPETGCKQ